MKTKFFCETELLKMYRRKILIPNHGDYVWFNEKQYLVDYVSIDLNKNLIEVICHFEYEE